MKDLLEKLGTYNMFNYLLPGVLFAAIASNLTKYYLIQEDLVVGSFVYYFLGLVISRIGSVLIEPVLKKTRFIEFSSYQDYVTASKKDELIPTLSEANNMYRTLTSLFFCLILLKIFNLIALKYHLLEKWDATIFVFGLLVLFLFSDRKQTTYITKRVQHNLSKD